jgi:signal peptidase I
VVRAPDKKPPVSKIVGKTITWTAVVVLIVIFLTLAFIYISPDYDIRLIWGGSMKPALNWWDLVITGPPGRPLNGDVNSGTIVTFQIESEIVVHRVISVQGDMLTTKGDAVENPDRWQLTLSEVKGIYLFKIPRVFYILVAFFIWKIYKAMHQVKLSEVEILIQSSRDARSKTTAPDPK